MQSQRPSSGFVRRRTASEVKQQRPKTSLGFAQKPDVSGRGRQLAGFDVSEYFRRHGSSAGLHIGVNGTPSGDAVIQSYVEDCRLEALVRELEQEEEEDEEAEEREIWRKNNEGSGCGESRIQLQRAPLCWDALLEKTEAKTALGLAKSPSNVIPQVSVRIPYGNEPKPRTRAVYATHGGTSGNMRRPLRMTRQDGIHRNTCPPVDDQSLTPGGVSVAPERRCQCEEIEDEDTTDLREIAEKYPELGIHVVDVEERRVVDWRMRRTAKLAVSVTMPSAFAEEKGRSMRKIYRSSPISQPVSSPHTSSGYIGIVKKHLSPYLN